MHPFDSLVQRNNWDYYEHDETNPNTSKVSGCERDRREDRHVSEIEAIRLLNAGNDSGIVEVKIKNLWGGICDDGFTITEANVACRQLGFELGAEANKHGLGEDYNDPINIFGLICNGDEKNVRSSYFDYLSIYISIWQTAITNINIRRVF